MAIEMVRILFSFCAEKLLESPCIRPQVVFEFKVECMLVNLCVQCMIRTNIMYSYVLYMLSTWVFCWLKATCMIGTNKNSVCLLKSLILILSFFNPLTLFLILMKSHEAIFFWYFFLLCICLYIEVSTKFLIFFP